jgi:hypothetical protein
MSNEFLSPYQVNKVLEGVIQALPVVRGTFLQSTLASGFTTRNTKTVNFDEEFAVKNAVAIFVDPKADVTPIQLGDFGHKEWYFAYSKEGWADDDFDVLDNRQLGDPLGQVNIAANQAARLIEKSVIAEQRFENLFEKTWAEIALYGAYEAYSEKHPRVRYDFGRNVTTTYVGWSDAIISSVNLTNAAVTAPWDSSVTILPTIATSGGVTQYSKVWTRALVTAGTATPVKDLIKMFESAQRWGETPQYYIMQDDAYDAFNFDVETNYKDAASSIVSTLLSTTREILPQAQNKDGLTMRRVWNFGGTTVPIYSYNAKYNARATGTSTAFIPAGWVIGVPGSNNGIKVYGRIKHPRANYAAMPRFINRWQDEKTAVNEFEVHTSFLQGHRKINALSAWKVV